MRKLFIILGLIAAIIAVVLAVLPLSNLAFIPAVAALIFGVIAFIQNKKVKASNITVNLIFLLTVISLGLATYKSVTTTQEVGDTQELEQRAQDSEKEAIDELEDLDI